MIIDCPSISQVLSGSSVSVFNELVDIGSARNLDCAAVQAPYQVAASGDHVAGEAGLSGVEMLYGETPFCNQPRGEGDMYGWRGKIGAIMPDNNTVLEPEMYTVLPDGVSLNCGRVVMRGAPAMERVPSGVAALPAIIEGLYKRVGVLAYACMTSSIFQEVGWHKKLEGELHGVPFLPARLPITGKRKTLWQRLNCHE